MNTSLGIAHVRPAWMALQITYILIYRAEFALPHESTYH